MSTIAAISTPPAAGGVAMLRISGEGAIDIAARVFVPLGKTPVGEMSGHTCAYGHVVDGGEVLDDAVLTIFRAPSSYTGENVAEISCHGGIYVSRRVLRAILAAGAEPAQPGEFTKRAFLNGKLSLTQAEAVADIISAEGDSALKSANLMHCGRLFREISAVRDSLVHVLGSLAAWTDYPEEDLPEASPENVAGELEEISQKIKKVIDSYDTGIIFRDGIRCAIVGRPNVGKSTLMNALLGYERSIVTPTAGTTRDVVEESLRLGDVVLKISDTAGLRESDDEAERIGVKLAERAIENAQLILAVFDGSRSTDDEDEKILEKIANRRHLVIINKSDLPQKIDKEYFKGENILYVSAKDGDGLKKIADAVYEMFGLSGAGQSEVYANERQRGCCERAQSQIRQAVDALAAGVTLDAVTVLLDSAADALLELTGERATEAVVNDVFGRFCVGK